MGIRAMKKIAFNNRSYSSNIGIKQDSGVALQGIIYNKIQEKASSVSDNTKKASSILEVNCHKASIYKG